MAYALGIQKGSREMIVQIDAVALLNIVEGWV